MIKSELLASLQSASSQAPQDKSDLSTYSLAELIALRAEIDALLPARSFATVNLEEELLLQYRMTQELMGNCMDSVGVPTNQKAQLINSCSTILASITKSQAEIFNAERVKKIEMVLLEVMKDQPEAVKTAFLERYAEAYGQHG